MKNNKTIKMPPTFKSGYNTIVMDNVSIGEGVVFGNNITIYPNTIIGDHTRILDNSVIGRLPFVAGIIDRKPSKNLKGLEIGERCVIGANVVLYAGSTIGNNVLISDFSSIREECKIGNDVVIGRNVIMNYNITIGNRCRIMDGCHFGGDMVLEDDVFFSPYVCSVNDNYMGIKKKRLLRKGPYIKKRAIIGANTTLLANIVIGENAIIGAGSLVTKSIPSCKVSYGVPARIIKDVGELKNN